MSVQSVVNIYEQERFDPSKNKSVVSASNAIMHSVHYTAINGEPFVLNSVLVNIATIRKSGGITEKEQNISVFLISTSMR